MEDDRAAPADATAGPSTSGQSHAPKPTVILVIGMAGSGKTTLIQRINSHLHATRRNGYIINMDPAVTHLPYGANIDIRDTVKYKNVMRQYNLGPNGGILTSCNLFATRFDQVVQLCEKPRDPPLEYVVVDTPGQIEIFTWSASGSIVTELFASSFPTLVAYVVDTPRVTQPQTFMSNMLQACSIMYKTKLPMLLLFNKVDVARHEFALEWMSDFDSYSAALEADSSYAATLSRSLALVLDSFYSNLRSVGVSAVTGEGMEDMLQQVAECAKEYREFYVPDLERRKQDKAAREEARQRKEMARLQADLAASKVQEGQGPAAAAVGSANGGAEDGGAVAAGGGAGSSTAAGAKGTGAEGGMASAQMAQGQGQAGMAVDGEVDADEEEGGRSEDCCARNVGFALLVLLVVLVYNEPAEANACRKHCVSRLQTLYKVLKMQHGRTKYQKRKLDVHHITDVRHLHVPLFNAERAWAYAMELKKEAEARGGGAAGGIDPRKRHHLIGRLAKAVLWASELARFAAARSDTQGALEAEAYCCWMGGNLLLERESDWELALAKFTRAKKLWQELAKACPNLEGQSLYLAQARRERGRVEEMEPNIRYCNYRISRAGGAVPADPSALLSAVSDVGARGGELPGGGDLLQSKLAALAQEAQMAQAASTSYVSWMGVNHPVRHERVKLALHQAAEFGAQAEQVMDSGEGDVLDSRLALYDKAINALAQAKSHVRNAVKGLAGPDAEAHFKELEALEVAVEGLRLQRTVERSEVHLAHTRTRFVAGLQRLAAGKKIKDKERHARPEEVVRVCDLLSRYLEDLADLGARMGGRAGEALHDVAAARALEAWALLSRSQDRASAAADQLRGLPAGDPAAEVLLRGRDGLLEDLGELVKQATAYKAVAQAEMFAAELKAKDELLQAGVGGLSLGDQQQQQTAGPQQQQQQTYLLEALDKWESFAGGPTAAAGTGAGASGAKAPPRLHKAPYGFMAIPVRPIMLDTASNCVSYPSLEHRLRKVCGHIGAAGCAARRIFCQSNGKIRFGLLSSDLVTVEF
ncbi:hypothetical protein VOLCADRAFT_102865 [Volvox carteri f. nagariensis]|uniref:GPN-loop GTPase 1 n=1 Tax=Volvox carteri f. nagariensis TaxID=3068 RepID=D8TIL4_VOLCA|nr:uncharacterized protein VOLCADRAFT_102865 [Volvox carteri f. nagariensis]EFJ53265.1 hypothetical protein VOLCADRAFT_102865 [Volvox carteri f. nagariensis]|eukprot:XP_002946270.1 hypothetical protein VOLCADRAFT_102865 [Volvox carteri f. nagariensis]